MKFIELINNLKWNEIKIKLMAKYPITEDNIVVYEDVFYKLKNLKPTESSYRIYFEEILEKEFDEEPYTSVSGRNGDLTKDLPEFKYMNNEPDFVEVKTEVSYGLEYTDWAEWLGMDIEKLTLKNYSTVDIVAHCLWEMTFCGFDQKTIRDNMNELKRRADEIKNMTKEERKENFISWDDIKDDF